MRPIFVVFMSRWFGTVKVWHGVIYTCLGGDHFVLIDYSGVEARNNRQSLMFFLR